MYQFANLDQSWDLDSLYDHPSTDTFQQTFQAYRNELTALAEESDTLPALDGDARSHETWLGFLKKNETLHAEAWSLSAFIGCHSAADAGEKLFQKLEGQLSALQPHHAKIATNVELALQQADDECFEALLASDGWLSERRFHFEECRRAAALRLPREQELLVADLAVDGISAWGRLYDRLAGEMRITVMEKGELIEKSPGQITFDSPQRAVRENNYFAWRKAWTGIGDICADALNHISGTRLTKVRHLGLEDHLVMPLHLNRLQRQTLETMWSIVTERKHVLLDFMNAKAKKFGLEKLTWYDIDAPWPAVDADVETIPYDKGCSLVVDSCQEFSPHFGEFAKKAIENRWIEAKDRDNKRPGGFCAGVPTRKESRIFMTYIDTPDSMSVLAHELGHAYHSHVLLDQPFALQDYPMNLAETASTFAEAVLGERRLQTAESDDQKLVMLDKMLCDSISFLMNIHARFLFEDRYYQERREGELSPERLSELMLQAQKDAYMNGLDDNGYAPEFWISKLHFYIRGVPFYNFPYAFGYLLSLGIYSLAGESGGDFAGKYQQFLIATGCMETEDAMQSSFGYDLREPDFWNRSMDIVTSRVEQFLQLCG